MKSDSGAWGNIPESVRGELVVEMKRGYSWAKRELEAAIKERAEGDLRSTKQRELVERCVAKLGEREAALRAIGETPCELEDGA